MRLSTRKLPIEFVECIGVVLHTLDFRLPIVYRTALNLLSVDAHHRLLRRMENRMPELVDEAFHVVLHRDEEGVHTAFGLAVGVADTRVGILV